MNVIVSPSKTMSFITKTKYNVSMPLYLDKSRVLVENLKKLSVDQISKIMKVNYNLAELNYKRYQDLCFDNNGSIAIYSYNGIQYKSMDLDGFTDTDMDFMNQTLFIVSGLYGLLRPLDCIYPYRLELKLPFEICGYSNLYQYWDDFIYKSLSLDNKFLVDLCSDEYGRLITKYLKSDDLYIKVSFKTYKSGKLKSLSTDSKKLRGLMVNFIVKNRLDSVYDLKKFSKNGYFYSPELSTNREFVFIKE